jgi:hypothetical protein
MRALMIALAIAATSGCAELRHRPVADFNEPEGIPYYEGTHYLLVHSDGKGGINWKILFLPDRNKKRVADPTVVLASLNTTLTFTNGMLGQSKEVADTTGVPKAIIAAVEKAAALLAPLNADLEKPHQLPPPHLYRMTWTSDRLQLVGGPADEPINITLYGGSK